MKWFSKYKISSALDADESPVSVRGLAKGSAELEAFAEELSALDYRLKQAPHEVTAPPFLRSSVMNAVRASVSSTPERSRYMRWPFLIRAGGALAVLAICIWGGRRLLHPQLPLGSPVAALQARVVAMPSALVSPLSEELKLLNSDLDSTKKFLLASMP